MDELFELATLIQTKKNFPFPIVLYGKKYWEGLLDWVKGEPIHNKYISPEDTNIMGLVDTSEEAVQYVVNNVKKL